MYSHPISSILGIFGPSPEKRLAFSPPSGADTQDMTAIDLDAAAHQISALLLGGLRTNPEIRVLSEG